MACFSGPGSRLDGARDEQGAVGGWADVERAVAPRQGAALLDRDFAARDKTCACVAAVAIRLVLRRTAAAQGGAKADLRAREPERAVKRQGAVFPQANHIDLGPLLLAPPPEPLIPVRPRRP